MMAKYDYVLLDADNTLWDFDLAEERALALTLQAHGYPATQETHRRYHQINRSLWEAFERGEIAQAEILARRFQGLMDVLGGEHNPDHMNLYYMEQLARQSHLLPGAEAFCRALAPFCTLAIVTNGVAMVQRGRFEPSPIRPLFREIFISTELGCQKPDRAFFEIVCRDLPIHDRRRAVIVGDSLSSDIQGGQNAGIDTIWYNPKRAPLAAVKPTFQAADYSSMVSLILE